MIKQDGGNKTWRKGRERRKERRMKSNRRRKRRRRRITKAYTRLSYSTRPILISEIYLTMDETIRCEEDRKRAVR